MTGTASFRNSAWDNFNWLLAALALALARPTRAATPPAAIPFAGIGARATASCQGDALGVRATADGARLRCGLQKLEGRATPEGLWLESTKPGAAGRMRLTATALCRAGLSTLNPQPSTFLPSSGAVSVQDKLVRFIRPGLTEEYSVSVDGVRQDFIIESPPLNPQRSTLNQSAGDLRVELALSGARAEAVAGGARLRLEGAGRILAYSRLRAEDATGRELTARLEVLSADRLAVSVADANASYPVRIDPTFSDADWISLGAGMTGMNYAVYALAVSGTDLYAGGVFGLAGGVVVTNIAKWDGNAWSALGGGIDDNPNTSPGVNALAVSGTNLYAAGRFTRAGGHWAASIAKWDGSAWSALGSGIPWSDPYYNAYVNALAVSGTDLYAAGWFTNAGGVLVTNIAKWDGNAWSALGWGLNGDVYALAVSGTNLYAGGNFTKAGGVPATNIAKWDGHAWSALGSGISGYGFCVYALLVSGTNLYAAGQFTTAGGVAATNIAKWDGRAWSTLGSGMNGAVSTLAVSGTDLYAGGRFTTAGGVAANYIAKWDGSAWSALGWGLDKDVYALAADGFGHLGVGGDFSRAGTNVSANIAQANVGLNSPVAPVILRPPTSQKTLIAGAPFFSATAEGSLPLGYEWFFGTNVITGATNSTLLLTNVQPWQAGVYTVVVTNAYGAATSGPAILEVLAPGTNVVTATTDAALRAAMAGGGTVTFACDGTITLSNTITNDVDLMLDGTGHQVTISGSGGVRVFCVKTNVTFTAINLTIANGSSAVGAGIYNDGGTVNLLSVSCLNNVGTDSGAAIFNHSGTVNATNCSFTGNTLRSGQTTARGGAIFNDGGPLRLQTCLFLSNSASAGAWIGTVAPSSGLGASGGAIHTDGTLNASDCTWVRNSASGGTGVGFLSGVLGGAAHGGAICNLGGMVIERSLFASNTLVGGIGGNGFNSYYTAAPNPPPGPAGGGASGGDSLGAALFVSGPSALVNCTLTANQAGGGSGGQGGRGGGWASMNDWTPNIWYPGGGGGFGGTACGAVYDAAGVLRATNCTIASNYSVGGPGGAGGPGFGGGTDGPAGASGRPTGALQTTNGVSVNGLLAGNSPTNGTGKIADGGHNLSSDASCAFTHPRSVNNINAKLGALADNGGPTLTMALLPGSPAIDAGDTSLAPATDQRGFPRPFGPAADIGAYESAFVLPEVWTLPATAVTSTNAILNAEVYPNGYPSAAWFEWGATTSYGNLTGWAALGSGTNVLPFSVPLAGLTNDVAYHYRVAASNSLGIIYGIDQSFIARDVGIVRSTTEDALRGALAGGGTVTFACDGTITLSSPVIIAADSALDSAGHQITLSGGNAVRIFCVTNNAVFSLANLTVSNGRAPSGGAILNAGGRLSASNCLFAANYASALSGYGGALQNQSGEVYLSACVFADNHSSGVTGANGLSGGSGRGGALDNSGTLTADLCNFTSNSAAGADGLSSGGSGGDGHGGAIGNFGTMTIMRSSFTRNSAAGGLGAYGFTGFYGDDPGMYGGSGGVGGSGGAGQGGAIYNAGTLRVIGTTLAYNSGHGGGAGRGGKAAGRPSYRVAPAATVEWAALEPARYSIRAAFNSSTALPPSTRARLGPAGAAGTEAMEATAAYTILLAAPEAPAERAVRVMVRSMAPLASLPIAPLPGIRAEVPPVEVVVQAARGPPGVGIPALLARPVPAAAESGPMALKWSTPCWQALETAAAPLRITGTI